MDTYINQQKSQLLDSLENQVRFSQLVAILVGEKGIGKTFLVKQLQKRLENDVLVVAIDAGLSMSEDQLEKNISLQLGLDWQSSDLGLEHRIQNDLGQKVLLSIDSAHLLSSSCLEFLLQLNQKQLKFQETVLFVLLAGENSLPKIISKTNTFKQHQEMCVVFQVEPILLEETKAVISACSHYDSDLIEELYNDDKLNYFWQLANGNPSELNFHLSKWLDDTSKTEVVEVSSQSSGSYVKSVSYFVVVTLLITALIFQEEINFWIKGDESELSKQVVTIDPKINDLPQGNKEVELDKSKNGDEKLTFSENPEKQSEKLADDGVADTNKLTATTKDAAVRSTTDIPEPLNQKEPSAIELVDKRLTSDNLTSSSTSPDKSKQNTEEQIKQSTSNKDQGKPTSESKKLEKAPKIVGKQISTKEKAVNDVPALKFSKDESFLLKQNDSGFALQWVVVSKPDTAASYRNKHPLKSRMRIYRRSSGNKLLYLVISEGYSTRQIAERAKDDYKKLGYSDTPWVKSMANIKKEINRL